LVESAKLNAPKPSFQSASTPAEALELLKSEPDHDTLVSTLLYLTTCPGFHIQSPSPLASQLVHVLVAEIVPNYWNVLQAGKKPRPAKQGSSSKLSGLQSLLSCFRSVSGINAVVLSLNRNIQQSKESKKSVGGPNFEELLRIYLQLLEVLLEGPQTVGIIWRSIYEVSGPQSKQNTIWKEFLSLVGGGKIIGISAEAEAIVNALSKKVDEKHWVADGSLFSSWLARNLTYWVKNLSTDSENGSKCCGELLSKSLRLGYTGQCKKTFRRKEDI
jgi:telomere length regulation protein